MEILWCAGQLCYVVEALAPFRIFEVGGLIANFVGRVSEKERQLSFAEISITFNPIY